MARVAWPPIPKFLQLRDEEIIKRWHVLVRYAARVPSYPAHAMYSNVLDTSRVVTARRQKRAPSLVWFHALSDEDVRALDELQEGEVTSPFFVDFKISTNCPFILSETQAVTMTKRNGQPAFPKGTKRQRFTLWKALRRARMVSKTSFFTPTVEELDALITYLENAEMHDTTEK